MMTNINRVAFFPLMLILGACASVDSRLTKEGAMQKITFDSNPTGAVCDIYSVPPDTWKEIPEVKEHVGDVAWAIKNKTQEKALKGIDLKQVPGDASLLYKGLAMPQTVEVRRSKNVLVTLCSLPGYQTLAHAYSYRNNWDSTLVNLADPTWFLADYLDAKTGYAYYYANTITTLMHKEGDQPSAAEKNAH